MFKDGRTNVHDEEQSGRPSVVSDDLVQSVDQKISERWHFTISELSCTFPHILPTVLYELITSFAQDGFDNNEELMECVKSWLSSMAQTSLTQAYKNLFPDMTSASIQAVTVEK
jgi:hypothetical protein